MKRKYNIGDIIKMQTGDIKILDIYNNNKNGRLMYEYECLKCHQIDIRTSIYIKNTSKCSICSNHKIIKGINDVATTHPHLVKYFKHKEDTYKYSYGTNKKVLMVCPKCGNEKLNSISKLSEKAFSCPKCGDNISYPEKFMFNVLEQLGIDFIYQFTKLNAEWCDKYRYDFYFKYNNEEYIIETHGIQHYTKGKSIKSKWNDLDKTKESDKNKENLAIQNGIKSKNYIIIDCRYSNLEWCKENILNSELNNIFNLNNINWEEWNKYALTSSLVEKVGNIKKQHPEFTSTQISKLIKVSICTTKKLLHKAMECGFCHYDSKYEFEKTLFDRKKVICLNDMKVFDSISECERFYNVNNVWEVCNHRYKTSQGLTFMYYDEYLTTPKEDIKINFNILYENVKITDLTENIIIKPKKENVRNWLQHNIENCTYSIITHIFERARKKSKNNEVYIYKNKYKIYISQH